MPVLAYKGSLIPVPTDLSKSVNYVGLFYALAMLLVSISGCESRGANVGGR